MLSYIKPYSFLPIKTPPLFLPTCSLMGGIWWQATNASPLIPLVALITLIYTHSSKIPMRNTFFIVAAFLVGAMLCYQQKKHYDNFFATTCEKTYTIQGKVLSISQIDHPLFNTIMTIHMTHTKEQSATTWHACNNNIQIYSATRHLPEIDDTIIIKSIQFKKPSNEDFNLYLCKENINATLFIPHVAFTIIHRPAWSAKRWFFNWRLAIFTQLQQKISTQTFSLFAALFLGNKQAEKEELNSHKDQFLLWGVSHQLARSGLHLIIFIAVWEFVLYLFFLTTIMRNILIILICGLYLILSWSSIGFVRALCMIVAYKFCMSMREPMSSTHMLCLICFTMLATNPLQLFFLNFQLNFALTFTLSWFNQLRTQQKQPFS